MVRCNSLCVDGTVYCAEGDKYIGFLSPAVAMVMMHRLELGVVKLSQV